MNGGPDPFEIRLLTLRRIPNPFRTYTITIPEPGPCGQLTRKTFRHDNWPERPDYEGNRPHVSVTVLDTTSAILDIGRKNKRRLGFTRSGHPCLPHYVFTRRTLRRVLRSLQLISGGRKKKTPSLTSGSPEERHTMNWPNLSPLWQGKLGHYVEKSQDTRFSHRVEWGLKTL